MDFVLCGWWFWFVSLLYCKFIVCDLSSPKENKILDSWTNLQTGLPGPVSIIGSRDSVYWTQSKGYGKFSKQLFHNTNNTYLCMYSRSIWPRGKKLGLRSNLTDSELGNAFERFNKGIGSYFISYSFEMIFLNWYPTWCLGLSIALLFRCFEEFLQVKFHITSIRT